MSNVNQLVLAALFTARQRKLTQRIKFLIVILLTLLLLMTCYMIGLADTQSVDAPTHADAQEQLQQLTLRQIEQQNQLLEHLTITPSIPLSTILAPLGPVGRKHEGMLVVDEPPRSSQRSAGPLLYNATCTVKHATDDGQPNTLRWCMAQSSARGIINFDPTVFSANLPVTLTLTSPLPFIQQNGIFLDGCAFDQNIKACTTSVILSGWQLDVGSGLVISGVVDVTINGLAISGFPDDGILLQGGAQHVLIGDENGRGRNIIIGNGRKPVGTTGDDAYPAGIRMRGATTAYNLVLGNWIGTADGQNANGNRSGIQIINGAHDNRLGGVIPAQRNLISGNLKSGLYIGNGSHNNFVLGNWIGVDAQGRQAVGNQFGMVVSDSSNDNQIGGVSTGAGNLISGNGEEHIRIETGSRRNRVQGNTIGVDVSGMYTVGISAHGIIIFQASDNQIGGAETGVRNLIAGCNTGISISGNTATGNTVQGNWIGVDATGKHALGNVSGVAIVQGSTNLIGGTMIGMGNLISGNRLNGIEIDNAATTNQVLGNWIGVDITGMNAVSNEQTGILIDAASTNVIGGETPGARNLISGNGNGLVIQNPTATHNQVLGNWIGVDVTGDGVLANREDGVLLLSGPQYNVLGGTTEGTRNLISGNNGHGINIQGVGTDYNQVLGNYIGTDLTGHNALGNARFGILLYDNASHNEIGGSTPGAGNLIGGNLRGVSIQMGSNENKVQGNKIGVDIVGSGTISNVLTGIAISDAAQNWIGGSERNAGNVISGNAVFGVAISGVNSNENRVIGNLIGLDSTGMFTVPYDINRLEVQYIGVNIWDGASRNIIGGQGEGEGNVISGHQKFGVSISGSNTANNRVSGNLIGTNSKGIYTLGVQSIGIRISEGANRNIVGGNKTSERNIISGNTLDGIQIVDLGTSQNQVSGNYIGLDVTGKITLGNLYGFFIGFGASNNLIGGDQRNQGNVISGNHDNGIWISTIGTMKNLIKGNLIGTDPSGITALGNGQGIRVDEGADQNELTNNVISGNSQLGFSLYGEHTMQNQVQGNFIGVNISGTKAISNGIWGITIDAGASGNLIGGTGGGEANVISGNGMIGIRISDTLSIDNRIVGNFIGTDATGARSIGNGAPGAVDVWNGSGVFLFGAHQNTVANNLISGNQKHGVLILGVNAKGNYVHDNRIGLSTNDRALPNQGSGIWLEEGSHNRIGISNTIAYNLGSGIVISGANAVGNTVTRTLIFDNRGPALDWRGPMPIDPAIKLTYDSTNRTLHGSACANCQVQVYAIANNKPAAKIYLGSVTADATGTFTLTLLQSPTLPYMTALATRPDGTTLPFATPLAIPVAPQSSLIYLPWVQR